MLHAYLAAVAIRDRHDRARFGMRRMKNGMFETADFFKEV